jgi:DNA-directed RNA polymerase specialized sigma subunit
LKKPAPLALVPAKAKAKAVAQSAPVERVPREQLLARYTPLIKYVVERLAVGCPRTSTTRT